MSSGFIGVACVMISFLFKADSYSILCVHHILFIHSSVGGQLAFFYLLAFVNNNAMNVGAQMTV